MTRFRALTLSLFILVMSCALFIPVGRLALAQGGGASEMWSFLSEGNFDPIIEGTYGYGLFSHKLFTEDLPTAGVVGLKLGFREVKNFKTWGKKLDERFLLGYYAKSDVPPGKTGTGEMTGEWWRVGAGQRSGYGWEIGKQSIIPYHQYSFNVSRLIFANYGSLTPADTALLTRTMGTGRLSMSTEGGAMVELFSTFSASLGYEATVVYPRVIFPQWICSYLLLGSCVVIISDFSQEIVSSSPILGPILYFAFRNAVAYGFFYAFHNDMNWPFSSETPFLTHTFKIDVSIRF
ncbi:MAG TPA: hypothetical protein VMM37_03455 [Bacteroidota bacterium]|nr:hypothetical protein [Bacteroidota bacterium]